MEYDSHPYSVTGQKFWYKPQKTAGRKVLPDALRKNFANTQIVVVEYDNITDDQQREMFQVRRFSFPLSTYGSDFEIQRVQLGMALTPAGKHSLVIFTLGTYT